MIRLLLLTVLWTGTAMAETNLGFYLQDSQDIPAAVKDVRSKIFRIKLPYYKSLSKQEYTELSEVPDLSPVTKAKLNQCLVEQKTSCSVPMGEISGTAFLDRDPHYVWTNCHIVANWMEHNIPSPSFQSLRELYSAAKSYSLPMKLIDQYGNLLLDGGEENILAAFSARRSLEGWLRTCNQQNDIVKIKIPPHLFQEGLNWSSTKNRSANKALYIGGVPRPTPRETVGEKSGSDGLSFYWTWGMGIDKGSPDSKLFLENNRADFAFVGPYIQGFFADGAEGMSGSPVLDQNGDLMGIYQSFIPRIKNDPNSPPLISMFTNTAGMRFIELYSE